MMILRSSPLSGAALISECYDVIQAFNGREAIRHFYTHPDIAIVLIRSLHAGEGGWDTFERIAGINPLLPIIIITARSDQYWSPTQPASVLWWKSRSM